MACCVMASTQLLVCCPFTNSKPRLGFLAQISEQESLIGSCGKTLLAAHPTIIPPNQFCSGEQPKVMNQNWFVKGNEM